MSCFFTCVGGALSGTCLIGSTSLCWNPRSEAINGEQPSSSTSISSNLSGTALAISCCSLCIFSIVFPIIFTGASITACLLLKIFCIYPWAYIGGFFIGGAIGLIIANYARQLFPSAEPRAPELPPAPPLPLQ